MLSELGRDLYLQRGFLVGHFPQKEKEMTVEVYVGLLGGLGGQFYFQRVFLVGHFLQKEKTADVYAL